MSCSYSFQYVCVLSHVRLFLQLHRLQLKRLLCPWNFPGKSTGTGCHFLLQGIFLRVETKSLVSPTLAGRLFTTRTTWEACNFQYCLLISVLLSLLSVLIFIVKITSNSSLISFSFLPHTFL